VVVGVLYLARFKITVAINICWTHRLAAYGFWLQGFRQRPQMEHSHLAMGSSSLTQFHMQTGKVI
jgi:hypothetical protein